MSAVPTLHGSLTTEVQRRLSHVVYNVVAARCTWKRAGAGSSVKPGLFFSGIGLIDLAKAVTDAISDEVNLMIEEAVQHERDTPPF